jgi:hypothetical protein
MVGRPGKQQSAFTAAELDPLMHERTELKYYGTGLARSENLEIYPQGGFGARRGLRDIGALEADAGRLLPFNASTGDAYDLVFRPEEFSAWDATSNLATVAVPDLVADMLPQFTSCQKFDTALLFHEDFETGRVKYTGPTSWTVDKAPYENVPLYDYGADIGGNPYTNGVAAIWRCEFVGLTSTSTVFTLTVSGQETLAITYNSTMATLTAAISTALSSLPNLAAGYAVASSAANKVEITFSGTDNLGDQWAVTGTVKNKSDAAIVSTKLTAGVTPGEEVMSGDRGWPSCGEFYQQRLTVGGFKGLPGAWMFSISADYYNFDDRISEANGPALVPMEVEGGEKIGRIIDNRYLTVFTSKGEYWISDRTLSRTTPPNHVQASTHGSKAGVPIVKNEGAAIFPHISGNVLGEFRWTDVEGNFVSTNTSLLASHLVRDVRDMAVRTAKLSTEGNLLAIVKGDGSAAVQTLLREQEIAAMSRFVSPNASFIAVACNGRNELSWIVERPSGRRLERSEEGLLVDEALDFDFGMSPSATLTGLTRFNGRQVWVIADEDVFGPFPVASGSVSLPKPVTLATVGTWSPPAADTLPLDRTIGPGLVLKRKARIHSVVLSLLDTTSVALGVNGRRLEDVDLRRYGMDADVPELAQGFTGDIKITGLAGWVDAPYVTVSQVRPGRLTVRSIDVQAQL